jgi:hypothetical protein
MREWTEGMRETFVATRETIVAMRVAIEGRRQMTLAIGEWSLPSHR